MCVCVGVSGHNQPHIYYLSQSKSSPKKQTNLEKRIITIPKSHPNLQVEPLSIDPLSNNFTGFAVRNSKTGELLGTFRAEDIVQQRNFMAALGGKGPGLFTHSADGVDSQFETDPISSTDAPDGISLNELTLRQQGFEKQASIIDKKQIPSYEYTMEIMSSEYYLPEWMKGATSQVGLPLQCEALPIYDASNPPSAKGKSLLRREVNDTLLPPHGPPVCSIVSVGYGKEVGLEPHQQAVWCMDKNMYYCLDHIKKSTFLHESQLPQSPKAVVSKREITCECTSIPHFGSLSIPENSALVRSAGERASRKPHGLVIDVSGADGKSAQDGHKGNNGIKGGIRDHYGDRNDGRSGSNGEQGARGKEGTDGASGRNLILNLTGDASHLDLNIPGCCSEVADLGGETCEEVILVNCRGGDGGDGGSGGDGGDGGDGEDGRKGEQRSDGGHGGDGGAGGQGGTGGRGGNAGSGGLCVIQATDSRLLMLVEADCRAGQGGDGGQGGRGGEGGKRGFGGEGGMWEELDASDPTQSETVTGMRGKPGMAGSSGANGELGSSGLAGRDGGTLWVVKDTSGEVLHSSDVRYNAEVTSLEVSGLQCSNVFEPNQQLNISNVTVVNSGGLPLPAGAVLSFPSTETVRFDPTTFTLPELAVGETLVVPMTFHGRIFDQESPNSPGPLDTEAKLSPRIELLGRPFEKSLLEQKLIITHPLTISFALSRKTVSRGEVTCLEIGIENVSRQTYGCLNDTNGSAWVQVHMDCRLIPLGVLASSESQQQDTFPYQVTFDSKIPDSMYIEIKEIRPGEVLVIPIAVQMESYAELCDICVWQADLWLRGKLIEYKIQEVRVSPAYSTVSSPSLLGDILMITSDKIKQDQFQFWKRIFELLGVSVDYWDTSYKSQDSSTWDQQQSSRTTSLEHDSQFHESDQQRAQEPSRFPHLNHMYHGKMIIFPHCTLEEVPTDVILSHFHSQNQGKCCDDLNSSMLLFLDPTFPESLEFYTYQYRGHSRLLRHLCSSEKFLQLPKDAYTGHHLLAPGTILPPDRSSKHAEKATMKKLEKDVPSQAVALTSSTSNVQHSGLFRYSYGAMHVRRCPLSRSCNFQCVDGAHGNLTSMGTDDPLLTTSSRTTPLGSKFGQVFLTVMCGLPLHCKLSILKKVEDKSSSDHIEFYLPNGVKLTKEELAAICIAHEVADELYNCTGEVNRMSYVLTDLDLSKALLRNGKRELISQMMDLIKQEVAERRKVLNFPPVVQASNEIQDLCNSWTATTDPPSPPPASQRKNCGDKASKVNTSSGSATSEKLPPLRLLQDTSRVLRSHQHFVDDDKYKISDLL